MSAVSELEVQLSAARQAAKTARDQAIEKAIGAKANQAACRAVLDESGWGAYAEAFKEANGAYPIDETGYPIITMDGASRITMNPSHPMHNGSHSPHGLPRPSNGR